MLNNKKLAFEEYTKALGLNTSNAEALNNLARLLLSLNKIDDVIKVLDILIKLKPMPICLLIPSSKQKRLLCI